MSIQTRVTYEYVRLRAENRRLKLAVAILLVAGALQWALYLFHAG